MSEGLPLSPEAIDAALHAKFPHRREQAAKFGWDDPYTMLERLAVELVLSAGLPVERTRWLAERDAAVHTFVCPGCDQEIDRTLGQGLRMMQTPLGKGVIAWWHSDCRMFVIGVDSDEGLRASLGLPEGEETR